MLVDAKTKAVRDQKFVMVVISGFMAAPLLGQVVALIVLICIAMQILSKSANRMKDLGSLALISVVYLFAMLVALSFNGGPSIIPFVDRLPLFAPPVISLILIVLGKGIVRKFGVVWLVWSVAGLFDRGMHATGMIRMAAMLFIVSYWGLTKMKAFLFDR